MAGNEISQNLSQSASTPAGNLAWLQSKGATYTAAGIGIASAIVVWMACFSVDPLADSREALARKDQAAKDKIRENAVVFAALDDSEKEKIRRVSNHMSAKSGAEWNKANLGIEIFQDWFESLPISDRDAIRQAGDAATRKSEVLRLLDENDAVVADSPGLGRGRFNLRVPASRFEELVAILEQAVGRNVDESRPPVLRVTEVFADEVGASTDRFAKFRAVRDIVSPHTDAILELLPRRIPEGYPIDRKLIAIKTVFESLDAEFQRLQRSQRITDEQIKAAFEARAEDEDRLLNLSSTEFRSELTKYVIFDQLRDEQTTLSEEQLEGLLTFSSRLREMIRTTGGGRGGPPRGDESFRPGGNRGRPDGRSFDGRGPGDRPPRGEGSNAERFDDRGGPRDRPRPPEGRRPE